MIAIDCGNTRIKWARFEGGQRLDSGHASLRGAEDPYALLSAALADVTGRVLVANVAGPAVGGRIAASVRSRHGLDPEFVSVEREAYGIECAYGDPHSLGVDRWLAMIAARRQVDGPVVVVSAGTAVTIDAVDSEGRHLGGLILPGDRLMIEALARNTDGIPVVPPVDKVVAGTRLLGRSTTEAVSHGTRLALVAAIDRAIATVRETLDTEISLLVTGGDGPALAEWLATKAVLSADLVLDGLAVVGEDEG